MRRLGVIGSAGLVVAGLALLAPAGVIAADMERRAAAEASAASAGQQPPRGRNATPDKPAAMQPPATGIAVPADYVIGPEDVLTIFFWREKDLSGDVQVRPDGRISLPLLNELEAAGQTPDQLRLRITEAANKFLAEPTVTVMVKQINSRKVFITGNINKPGQYPLGGPTTVLQLITMAGGLSEFADGKKIGIIRTENGKSVRLPFNYQEVERGTRLEQNILLRPGDTITVP